MPAVWRLAAALGSIGTLLIALFVTIFSSEVLAQSSVGRAANAATGQSLRDAVEQNQKDFIDNEVLGPSAGGAPGGAGAALGAGASPTGRLRRSDHDPTKVPFVDENNYAWSTREASVFGTGVYTMPGTVLGGQLKVSIFGGHNWLSLEMKNGGGNILDTANGQFGKASNESVIVGGTALWAQKNTYVLASVVGLWGETSLSDAIDFCDTPTPGCHLRRYDYDTSGFIGTLTAGHVFALSASPTGPMLDLRASGSYTQNIGNTFANFEGDLQKWTFSTWTLTGSATLFSNIPLQNSALLRPYLQGYVRQEIDYRNKLAFNLIAGGSGIVLYDQAHTYGGVDLGLTYTLGNMTLGSAIYYDASADESTLGGRLGISWKLN
jgi:hypothetical protein